MGTAFAIILGTMALTPIAAPFVALHWLGEKLMTAVGGAAGYLQAFFHLIFS